MKKKSIIGLFVCLLGMGMTTSCEDMLTPDMDRYAESFSGRDTVGFYLGILRDLQGVIEQNVILGEVRSDLVETTDYASDSVSNIANFQQPEDGDNALLNRSAYYKVINQCNFYLATVDTMAENRGKKFMRKECAQVELIRAWTYMQLVQNYGTVPFITVPVDRANTGWETSPAEGWVNADNLLDKLGSHLQQAIAYEKTEGFPNYGTFESGLSGVNFSHSSLLFPSDLVMGDLYLLRGRDKSDYEKAAAYYYEYLKEHLGNYNASLASYNKFTFGGRDSYTPSVSNWTSQISGNERFTGIPSASNSFFGKVLTRIPQIYGFDTRSYNSTESGESSDGSDATTSGSISVTPNYKSRQVTASKAFENLCQSQIYRIYDDFSTSGDESVPLDVEYPEVGDARLWGTAPYVSTEIGKLRFIQKFVLSGSLSSDGVASGFSFIFNIPVYRFRQIYLRYAEAINRAGFPRLAFSLLRDGISPEEYPVIKTDSFIHIDDELKTMETCPYLEYKHDNYEGLTVDEMRRAEGISWLNFSNLNDWPVTILYGSHTLGCGYSYPIDSLYTYDEVVVQRVLDEALRTGSDVSQSVRRRLLDDGETVEGEDTEDPEEPEGPDYSDYEILPPVAPAEADPAEINAVETLIADEMALETAFEGFRYYDLMRIARHKDKDAWGAGNYGTEWMAWKIARRALPLKPYEHPSEKDATIYNYFLNPENWYLKNPVGQ